MSQLCVFTLQIDVFFRDNLRVDLGLIMVLEGREVSIQIFVKHPGVSTACMNKVLSH